ncbi:MAG: cell division protein ZapA [Deltaproteobacteria bacterium]|nr:cell division protein ZapA [Deltaproteobacteria bacterium]
MSGRKVGSVTVTLAGQKLNIRSEHAEAHIQQLAAYVERHVKDLQRVSKPSVPTHQIALLAAMNIADELFNMQSEGKEFRAKVAHKGEHLLRAIENALASRAALLRDSELPHASHAREAKA